MKLVEAECTSEKEKEKIMRNKKKLEATKCYVRNDSTYKERKTKRARALEDCVRV